MCPSPSIPLHQLPLQPPIFILETLKNAVMQVWESGSHICKNMNVKQPSRKIGEVIKNPPKIRDVI